MTTSKKRRSKDEWHVKLVKYRNLIDSKLIVKSKQNCILCDEELHTVYSLWIYLHF